MYVSAVQMLFWSCRLMLTGTSTCCREVTWSCMSQVALWTGAWPWIKQISPSGEALHQVVQHLQKLSLQAMFEWFQSCMAESLWGLVRNPCARFRPLLLMDKSTPSSNKLNLCTCFHFGLSCMLGPCGGGRA